MGSDSSLGRCHQRVRRGRHPPGVPKSVPSRRRLNSSPRQSTPCRMNDIHLDECPRDRLKELEVLVGAIPWEFESPSPYHFFQHRRRRSPGSRRPEGRPANGSPWSRQCWATGVRRRANSRSRSSMLLQDPANLTDSGPGYPAERSSASLPIAAAAGRIARRRLA